MPLGTERTKNAICISMVKDESTLSAGKDVKNADHGLSRRSAIGAAAASAFAAAYYPTQAFGADISNSTSASDTAVIEKGKKFAIFGAALVAADVIAGLVYGKSLLGIMSGKEDPDNWKTRLANMLLQGPPATLADAMAQMEAALARGDGPKARALLEDAEARFANPEAAAAANPKELESLGKLRRKVLFSQWKAGAESRSPARTPADRERLLALKAARKAEARRMLDEENAEQNERISRGRAKEAGDQGYMEAEELLRAGRLDEARQALALAEQNWGTAGMLGLGGRPFESAIEGLIAQIDAAAAAAGQQA